MAIIIAPQNGFQQHFLSNAADIVIGGGMAGVGKSFSGLLSLLYYVEVDGYNAVAFRRTTPMITNEGGLLSESKTLYTLAGGKLKLNPIKWSFNGGKANIAFTHLQHERNADDHKGAQYAGILFDELTHFTRKQFLEIISRNRSTCGIRPFVKATCNPDPDSFVYDYVRWYLDDEGYPRSDRVGKIRYMYTKTNTIIWGNTPQEVYDQEPDELRMVAHRSNTKVQNLITSFSFVTGKLADNKELIKRDPQYIAKLASLPENEKLRLMYGCWKQHTDTDALIDYDRIRSIYEGIVIDLSAKVYITVDVARFGRDWAVICVHRGHVVTHMEIWTRCSLDVLNERIVLNQNRYSVPATRVIVDEGGVGGGLIDYGAGYIGFNANATPINGEQYMNLKTQLHYVYAEMINQHKVKIDLSSLLIDGVENMFINVGSNAKEVRLLINEQLKSVKRKKGTTPHDKKALISKEEQRSLISTSSPDISDALVLRGYFDLITQKPYFGNFNPHRSVSVNLAQHDLLPIHIALHSVVGNTAMAVVSQLVPMTTSTTINVLAVYSDETLEGVIKKALVSHKKANTSVMYYLRPSKFVKDDIATSMYMTDIKNIRQYMEKHGVNEFGDRASKRPIEDVRMHDLAKKILSGEINVHLRIDANNAWLLINDLSAAKMQSNAELKERHHTVGMATDAFLGMCRTIFDNL